MKFSIFAAALASALTARAADITILVGDGGALAFNPPSATANVGDNVIFEFRAKNHSVTQSTFANPCSIMTTPLQGIDSGFQPVPANATAFPSWSFTVDNATNPLWFFCAQTNPANHCQKGMVFALNPTAAKTAAAFQVCPIAAAMASGSNATTSGAPPAGASGFSTVVGGSGAPTGSTSGSAPAKTNANSALRLGASAATVLGAVALGALLL
ncbi:hypothetical protein BDN72DRAFT_871394 [Pluteus cervinus]|uniref:Uncharacterized protein n=1 Tax=Pluteus cervinus TaxID=181527 RepID=A0ACD3ANE2_9AGAR|nr:hypothetical protein BDN72DRAFT_871394 [Pluteus cervinus]